MADNNSNQISDKIKHKYQLQGIIPGIVKVPHLGVFDLRKIDLQTADELFNSGRCPFLIPIKKKST